MRTNGGRLTDRFLSRFVAPLALMLAVATVFVATPATASPDLGVSVSLSLSATTVVTGSTLHATLVITNDSGHPVYYGKNCRDNGVEVGLSSKSEPFTPLWTGPSCAGKLLVDTRRVLSLSIPATYVPCSGNRKCLDLRATPLPTGVYNTQIAFRGFPVGTGTPSEPVIVTVVKANSPRRTGTIVGRFLLSPAIVVGPDPPLSGTITFTPEHANTSVKAVVMKVGKTGSFEAHLLPGTWEVTGESPNYQGGSARCSAGTASVVRSDEITKVAVVCTEI